MTPRQRFERYEVEGGDPIHKYINKLVEDRVLERALEVVEWNLLPEDWNISPNEAKKIKHELITKRDNIADEIRVMANEIAGEELKIAEDEVSVLSDEDVREMAKQKLHILAGIHHFNEKQEEVVEEDIEKLDEDVA